MKLRPYQGGAIDAVFDYWKTEGGSPLIDLATGLGKSVVCAKLLQEILRRFPTMRVMMTVHVRELVQQNFMALRRAWPDAPVGIYSAGLNKRDVHQKIIFGSIQSVYNKAELFGPRQLVVIDEAHLVPHKSDGMYRTFLDGLRETYPNLRIVGLTATPFRLDSGRLDAGDDKLFDRIVYDYGIGPATDDGWLCPLTAKLGDVEINVDGVTKRGGEFVNSDLQHAANDSDIVAQACDDIIRRGADRRSWLIFCTGIDHAENVAAVLKQRGISAATVTGKTPKSERSRILEAFKAGQIRALTNANVLTTGFDAPNVDLIALLRPTLSTGLYVQMMGRGTRIFGADVNQYETAADRVTAIQSSPKPNCLVLDFAGNVRRHGPVDAIFAKEETPRSKREPDEEEIGRVAVDEVSAKACPDCETLVPANAQRCKYCGFEFGEPKHDAQAEEVAVMSRDLKEIWLPVLSWTKQGWHKANDPNAKPTLRVDILAGVQSYSEFIPFEHMSQGAFRRAADWWRAHGGLLHIPRSVEEAIDRWHELKPPTEITLKRDGKFMRIDQRRFDYGERRKQA